LEAIISGLLLGTYLALGCTILEMLRNKFSQQMQSNNFKSQLSFGTCRFTTVPYYQNLICRGENMVVIVSFRREAAN
jgi:thiazole synthase ThiGH ThiG subunit